MLAHAVDHSQRAESEFHFSKLTFEYASGVDPFVTSPRKLAEFRTNEYTPLTGVTIVLPRVTVKVRLPLAPATTTEISVRVAPDASFHGGLMASLYVPVVAKVMPNTPLWLAIVPPTYSSQFSQSVVFTLRISTQKLLAPET